MEEQSKWSVNILPRLLNMRMREEFMEEGLTKDRAEGRAEGQKSMARALYHSGVTLETIALSAGVSVEQVKKWISEPEPESAAG